MTPYRGFYICIVQNTSQKDVLVRPNPLYGLSAYIRLLLPTALAGVVAWAQQALGSPDLTFQLSS